MSLESSRAFLLQTDRPDRVEILRDALRRAGVQHETALVHGSPPSVAFLVAASQLALARSVTRPLMQDRDRLEVHAAPDLDRGFDGGFEGNLDEDLDEDRDEVRDDEFDDEDRQEPDGPPAEFPAAALQWAGGLALLHMLIVFWASSPWNPGLDLPRRMGLVDSLWPSEPWRFLSYLFVHGDPAHAFWNGLPLIVFAVPLIEAVGVTKTSWIYTTAGVIGGWVGLRFLDPGGILIGSSGAVAGLFGGWITLTLRRDRLRGDGWRGPIRTWGVALLFLPSLLQPATSDGTPISVGAHMGGWLAGMAVGALLGRWVWRRAEVAGESSRFSSPTAPESREDR